MATLQPTADPYSEPYWAGLREGVLRAPRCRQCHRFQFPAGPCCSDCLAQDFEWVTLSGRGRVYAYVVYHHAFDPAFQGKLPYNVAEIRLEEGVKLISNVVGIENNQIRNEMPVRACFLKVDEQLTLLQFESA